MYTRVTVHRVKPQDRSAYAQALKEESEKVLELEPRTRNYYFLQDINDENIFFIIAIFEDRAAHQEHINTPHLKQMQALLKSLGIHPEQVGKWEAANIVPDDLHWR